MNETAVVGNNVKVNQEVISQPEVQPQKKSKSIVRICKHIKDDGIRCATPAVNGRHFCYYHCRAHHPGAQVGTRRYRTPIPESVASLQIALGHTLQALGAGEISPRQANSMMYGLNTGARFLRLSQPLTEAERQQVVTDVPEEMRQVLEPPEPDNSRNEYANESDDQNSATESEPEPLDEHEIARLRSFCLSPEQLREYQDQRKALEGTTTRASTRLTSVSPGIRTPRRRFENSAPCNP